VTDEPNLEQQTKWARAVRNSGKINDGEFCGHHFPIQWVYKTGRRRSVPLESHDKWHMATLLQRSRRINERWGKGICHWMRLAANNSKNVRFPSRRCKEPNQAEILADPKLPNMNNHHHVHRHVLLPMTEETTHRLISSSPKKNRLGADGLTLPIRLLRRTNFLLRR
jgi:hypothetical protein